MLGYKDEKDLQADQGKGLPDTGPIEPEDRRKGRPNFIKWFLILVLILYTALAYYKAPLLTRLGQYLVVAHTPEKADLIVCLAGEEIPRGLEALDAYHQGLAPRIFIARETPSDGYREVRARGLTYPETRDLLSAFLIEAGVNRSHILTHDRPVDSTYEEAEVVYGVVRENGYRSIIVITSPVHSRRAWWAFKQRFKEGAVRISMLPSSYASFDPQKWWTESRSVREVLIEYQKLIYYWLAYS